MRTWLIIYLEIRGKPMPVFAGIVVDVRALNGMYSTNIPLSMTLLNAHVRPLCDKPLGGFSLSTAAVASFLINNLTGHTFC